MRGLLILFLFSAHAYRQYTDRKFLKRSDAWKMRRVTITANVELVFVMLSQITVWTTCTAEMEFAKVEDLLYLIFPILCCKLLIR